MIILVRQVIQAWATNFKHSIELSASSWVLIATVLFEIALNAEEMQYVIFITHDNWNALQLEDHLSTFQLHTWTLTVDSN